MSIVLKSAIRKNRGKYIHLGHCIIRILAVLDLDEMYFSDNVTFSRYFPQHTIITCRLGASLTVSHTYAHTHTHTISATHKQSLCVRCWCCCRLLSVSLASDYDFIINIKAKTGRCTCVALAPGQENTRPIRSAQTKAKVYSTHSENEQLRPA